jgi:(2Fe-2S) ferredoxin
MMVELYVFTQKSVKPLTRFWYGGVTKDRLDEIFDALEEGKAVEEYFIA